MQFYFDARQMKVTTSLDQYPMTSTWLDIAGQSGHENTLDVLTVLARQHTSAQKRLRAWCAASRLSPSNAGDFLRQAEKDKEVYVGRKLARYLENG